MGTCLLPGRARGRWLELKFCLQNQRFVGIDALQETPRLTVRLGRVPLPPSLKATAGECAQARTDEGRLGCAGRT